MQVSGNQCCSDASVEESSEPIPPAEVLSVMGDSFIHLQYPSSKNRKKEGNEGLLEDLEGENKVGASLREGAAIRQFQQANQESETDQLDLIMCHLRRNREEFTNQRE